MCARAETALLVALAQRAIEADARFYEKLDSARQDAVEDDVRWDEYENAFDLLDFRSSAAELSKQVLEAAHAAVEKEGGVAEADEESTWVELDLARGKMELRGDFWGADYSDPNLDIEVPEELHCTEIGAALRKLGATFVHVDWTTSRHPLGFEDVGVIRYSVFAEWNFDRVKLAEAVVRKGQGR